jgi:hypothetical protein
MFTDENTHIFHQYFSIFHLYVFMKFIVIMKIYSTSHSTLDIPKIR